MPPALGGLFICYMECYSINTMLDFVIFLKNSLSSSTAVIWFTLFDGGLSCLSRRFLICVPCENKIPYVADRNSIVCVIDHSRARWNRNVFGFFFFFILILTLSFRDLTSYLIFIGQISHIPILVYVALIPLPLWILNNLNNLHLPYFLICSNFTMFESGVSVQVIAIPL